MLVLKGINEDVIYDAVEFNHLTDQLSALSNECSLLREANVNSITPLLNDARKCKKLTMEIRNLMLQSCEPVADNCIPGFNSKVCMHIFGDKVHVYSYTYTYIHRYIHTYIHTCIHIRTYMHVYICISPSCPHDYHNFLYHHIGTIILK